MMLTLQDLVDGLGRRLGVPVTLEDAHMRLLVHNAHPDEVDPARQRLILSRQAEDWAVRWGREIGLYDAVSPIRLPLNPERGVTVPRVVVPIRWEGALLGWLWLIEPANGLGEDALSEAVAAAEQAAHIMMRDRRANQRDRQARSEILRALVSDDARERDDAIRRAGEHTALREGPWRACLVRSRGGQAAEKLSARLQDVLPAGEGHTCLLGTTVAVLSIVRDSLVTDGGRLGARIRGELTPDADGLAMGVGGVAWSLEEVATSHAQAVAALRVAEVEAEESLATWEQLGAYRALLALPDPTDVALIHPGVAALSGAGDEGDLLATVEVYLDEGGKAARAAERLHVHRGTLYYRLRRFEELTATDLDDGRQRLAVHLALKARRLAGDD